MSIRVLYQRDYLHLLVKYGLEPPSQLVDAAGASGARRCSRFGPGAGRAAGARRRAATGRDRRAGAATSLHCGTARSTREHRALGARMVPFGGWDMPLQYTRRARGAPGVP